MGVYLAMLLLLTTVFGFQFPVSAETSCTTPRNTSGECVRIHDCPLILNILKNNKLNEQITQYLQAHSCGYDHKTPKVCCENDTGPCLTAEKTGGICLPIKKCDSLMQLLERTPFLSDKTVNYLRKSQCQLQGDFRARVCCPVVKINDRLTVENDLPLPGECGVQETGNRLLGGDDTGITEFPWMAILEYGPMDKATLGCGASLISSKLVLTAAHCVTGSQVSRYGNLQRVRLGEYDINNTTDCVNDLGYEDCADPPLRIEVDSIKIHEEFSLKNQNRSHDIALIKLKESVKYSDFIRPICLPITKPNLSDWFYVAGWGTTETAKQSAVKQKLRLPLYDKETCTAYYVKTRFGPTLGDGQFCAGGEEGKDSCRGDSGGPIMASLPGGPEGHAWYQFGIVSFGTTPCGKKQPGVYTLLSEYIPWIQEQIRDW